MTKITECLANSSDDCDDLMMKNFSKRMLKTQMFIGNFVEKRFVEPLNSYRDVVKIDADETDFIENVLAVKKKVKQELRANVLKNPVWVGITDPSMIGAPVGYNLWVILPVEVFGTYWFKVKTVEFLQNEVRLKLEVVRSLKSEKSYSEAVVNKETIDLKSYLENIPQVLKNNFLQFCNNHVTVSNVKETITFIFVLLGTLLAGGINLIHYLMEYFLKLLREISSLIKVSTPIFITFINLIGKTVYGLYALIASLWHGRRTQQPIYNAYYSVDPNSIAFQNSYGRSNYLNNNRAYRALPYGSARITPLDD
ncbi:uncharacterized protein LOC115876192 [Sitophilus oryzae]|uniref:Uncharacterized protein LOC115876192 n=1 Tax=Sitophilus oryzae TaxID=7048 RepID=A0A6J2X992_SITOR|nr:uncharacterized protein LOC115876192 [Sitophilus oryzae]XP_030747751.1 uncharacterized protein LOC115876192 [Sitophilus oryzae]